MAYTPVLPVTLTWEDTSVVSRSIVADHLETAYEVYHLLKRRDSTVSIDMTDAADIQFAAGVGPAFGA